VKGAAEAGALVLSSFFLSVASVVEGKVNLHQHHVRQSRQRRGRSWQVQGRQVRLAGNATHDNKKVRIIPRHVQLAVRNHEELNKLLAGITIAAGGFGQSACRVPQNLWR